MKIHDRIIELWPDHKNFLEKIDKELIKDRPDLFEAVYSIVSTDLDKFILGYRWVVEMMIEEEIHFRRSGQYRNKDFTQVNSEIYQLKNYMSKYVDGLLLSQILWPNHVMLMDYYVKNFLKRIELTAMGQHLEVGPGHGLFLHFTAMNCNVNIEAWDISPTSVEYVQNNLRILGTDKRVHLKCKNLFDLIDPISYKLYSSMVLSEILEHLEEPKLALFQLIKLLKPGALIFINVPVNSPAIDHIFLFKSPEEVIELILETGLKIIDTYYCPAAGYSEDKARRMKTTISCAFICQK